MIDVLKSIVEPLEKSASVTSVYGEPVSAQGRTVIPVARIAYGFGGGSGHGARHTSPAEGEGEGGGGGGGVLANPLGVIEITDQHTRYIPLRDTPKLAAAGAVGLVLGFLLFRRKRS